MSPQQRYTEAMIKNNTVIEHKKKITMTFASNPETKDNGNEPVLEHSTIDKKI
jgi:hypothetical protein